ncbi:MAG: lauroyl acyltransferase [Hyphomicrobiales bacterium]|nr:lauroyl acyltransferase [Hyphomicrobiales bacterium]MCP5371119.1 lauroyl acyltransferase [Hyphomicrobiales bacterium]
MSEPAADRLPRGRRLAYRLQAWGAWAFYGLVGLLPARTASDLGGWLGRLVGPRAAVSRRARRNLERAFPDKSPDQIDAILAGMWDNLGRTLFEFPHLARFRFNTPGAEVEIVGVEHLELLRDDGAPGIFFSGHMANWEVAALTTSHIGLPIHLIYRAPNNPYADALFRRRHPYEGEMLPKGPRGARRAMKLLGQGGHLGMLVDQKMNDGIPVPFFGRDAMTAPALAQLALRYRCPVVPARVERLGPAHMRVTLFPPMDLPDSGDRAADVAAVMARVNGMLEAWIRERPEQWLWLHNRWPD